MQIVGQGQETFLYLSGLGVCRTIRLSADVELLSAECDPEPDDIISVAKNEVDIGVMSIFLRQVKCQLRVSATDPKALAMLAWNTLWDGVILSALYDCEAVCNFQCDKPAEEFDARANLEVTNYHFRGFANTPRIIDDQGAAWIEENFDSARKLLSEPKYQNAVHCLATYRWHTQVRARLALLWAGIEGLFDIDSELTFRLSLYAARFLSPEDKDEMREIFKTTKKLYSQRSAAVHGSRIKGDANQAVADSVELLQMLIRRCILLNSLPISDELVP